MTKNVGKHTLGPDFCSALRMLTIMRKIVTSNAVRPGIMSTGIRNPMNDVIVSKPVGRKVFKRNRLGFLSNIAVNPLRE